MCLLIGMSPVRTLKHIWFVIEWVSYVIYIVACHLSKGSYFRWRGDMSGGLTNAVLPQCGWSAERFNTGETPRILAFTNNAHNRLQQLLITVKLSPRHTNSHTIPNLALRVGHDNMFLGSEINKYILKKIHPYPYNNRNQQCPAICGFISCIITGPIWSVIRIYSNSYVPSCQQRLRN